MIFSLFHILTQYATINNDENLDFFLSFNNTKLLEIDVFHIILKAKMCKLFEIWMWLM